MGTVDTKRSRAGWSPEEESQLFSLAAEAQRKKAPLRAVFDEVAMRTGRRPNSVRNYYYMRVRGEGEPGFEHRRAFTPFSGEEAAMLLEEVLKAQAEGESVRACTLRLAGGSDKAMLRFQNKYRALLKNDEPFVRQVMADMEKRGIPAVDPYAVHTGRPRVGRPRKTALNARAGETAILERLRSVDGLDVDALLISLGTLAQSAVNGAMQGGGSAVHGALSAENEALKAGLSSLQLRYGALLGCFTQLVRLNSSFLSQNSLGRVSNLSVYIRDLELNMQRCERLMAE